MVTNPVVTNMETNDSEVHGSSLGGVLAACLLLRIGECHPRRIVLARKKKPMKARVLTCLSVISMLSLLASMAQAQHLQFSAPVTYAVGNSPQQVVAADLNGDGKQDLVVLNGGDQTISVLLGNGDGTFQPAIAQPAGSSIVSTIAVADLVGDGKPDLAVSNGSANSVSIMLGNGNGTFQAAVQYNLTTSADFVAIADFNGDKKPDLLVVSSGGPGTSNPTTGTIAILLNNGDGTFQVPKTTTTGSYVGTTAFVAVGDFNNDGKLDVATANSAVPGNCINGANCTSANVIVFPGNGDGTFQSPIVSSVEGAPFPVLLTAAGFTANQEPDLAELGYDSYKTTIGFAAHNDAVNILMGNGDSDFSANSIATLPNCQCTALETYATNLVATDLNADGKLDLIFPVAVLGDAQSSTIWALLGNGDGTFQPAQTFNLGELPTWMASADFNGDGLPDTVVAAGAANNVSVMLNATATFSLSAAVPSLTLSAGGQQTDLLTITAFNGFANAVSLACSVSGPAPEPTCSLSKSSVTPGANPTTSTLTTTAPASAAAAHPRVSPNDPRMRFAYAACLPFVLGVMLLGSRRMSAGRMLGGILLIVLLQAACGGGSSSSQVQTTQSQIYTVTVTGTSGAYQHTTQVTVTLRQ